MKFSKHMTLKHSWLAVSFVLCAVFLFVLYFYLHISRAGIGSLYRVAPDGTFRVPAIRIAIGNSIRTMGSKNAYDALKKSFMGRPVQESHLAAHLFGEALYASDGLDGILICDSSFGFGCYHSFFGKAIADKGKDIVVQLDTICVQKYGLMGLGCPHGIGHGLGEYFGASQLEHQLEICETLSWKGELFGCAGGVFMEYNVPTNQSPSSVATSARAYSEDTPYGACLQVSETFRSACFLELSSWWEQVLVKDYKKMGLLCGELHSQADSEACFLGIGYSGGPSSNYNIDATISLCQQMPTPLGTLLCRAGASWSFFADPTQRASASALCVYTDTNQSELCKQKSDLLMYKRI